MSNSQIPSPARDRAFATPEGKLRWQRGMTMFEVTEQMCKAMDEEGVSRADLARLLGKTNGFVTQILHGDTNMTLSTISDVFTVLGRELRVSSPAIGTPRLAKPTIRLFVGHDVPQFVESEDEWLEPSIPEQLPRFRAVS